MNEQEKRQAEINKRFDDIFGDEDGRDDVSLESAIEANQQPATKTATVEVYDTELGLATETITVKSEYLAPIEMISNVAPVAIDGIFYFIDDNGFLTVDVHDGAENKKIRFVGDAEEEANRETMLTTDDMKAAEAYRAEVDELMSEDAN